MAQISEYFLKPKSLGANVKAELASSKSDIDKLDIANFDKRTDFHDKIKNLNKKIT